MTRARCRRGEHSPCGRCPGVEIDKLAPSIQKSAVYNSYVPTPLFGTRRLSRDDFVDDRHAARYTREFEVHAAAMQRLLELLNEPDSERRLEEAELRHGMPALAGIIDEIESDAAIEDIQRSESDGYASVRPSGSP